MRIVFVTTEFVTEEYFSGGLANYLHRLSIALVRLGHDVHVIVSSDVDASFVQGGILIHRVRGVGAWWARGALRILPQAPFYWLAQAFTFWRKLRTLHQESPVDIVQVPNLQACGLFIVVFSRIPSVTRLSSYAGWDQGRPIPRRPLGDRIANWLERTQVSRSRFVFAPSQRIAARVARRKRSRSVRVIRSPAFVEVSPGAFEPIPQLTGKSYLVFAGRLEPRKGVAVLAEALPAVFRRLPDCEAVFVGQDRRDDSGRSMTEYIRDCARGFVARIHFLGELPHARLYPAIQAARLVVLPSLDDNFPNAMLEAMLLGRPVLGTIGASFDEVIEDGRTGFLVHPGDPTALADKIVEAWNHPGREQIGQQGREVVQSFTPEITVPQLLEYYQQVITASPDPGRNVSADH